MEKRMSRTDYLFSLLFVFMLVCATGAFFFGYRLGVDRTAERLAPTSGRNGDTAPPAAYRQQDLVSFYHNVYEPFQTFADRWFSFEEALPDNVASGETAGRLDRLADAARQAYKAAETFGVSSPSPLLEQAHASYLKSLKLFAEGAGQPAAAVGQNEFFREAKRYALEAQRQYYASILKWEETVHPVPALELVEKSDLSFEDWARLNLNAKNLYVASFLERNGYFLPVRPHDLTARIDELIRSDQARKWNATAINPLAQLIIDTDAVRRDDFARSKDRLYAGQLLPDLPFFYGASEMAANRRP